MIESSFDTKSRLGGEFEPVVYTIYGITCLTERRDFMTLRIATSIREPQYLAYCRAQGINIAHVELEKNDELGNIEKLKGFDGVIAMSEPYSSRLLEELKDNLKIIIRHGIGYDRVDIQYAQKLGICCCNTPGAMSTGVAETALTMMLELCRKFYLYNANLSRGRWDKGIKTNQFEGSTIGLVGLAILLSVWHDI